MSQVTEDDVLKIARLAQLTLTDEERTLFTKELNAILAYAERIRALDTENVEPTSHAIISGSWRGAPPPRPMGSGLSGDAFREDEEGVCLSRNEALGLAPEEGGGLFKVPRVIR